MCLCRLRNQSRQTRLTKMSSFIYTAFVILQFVCSGLKADADKYFRHDYVFNSDQQNFYKVHRTAKTWFEAKGICKLEGASLAVPENKFEAETLLQIVNTKVPKAEGFYIGVQDIISEGVFTSDDGTSIDDLYHVWEDGQPDNKDGNENCVKMSKLGFLSDVNCYTLLPFVCKKLLLTVEWNSQCEIADPGYVYNKDLGKCYKMNLVPKNWTDAYKICAAQESYLAVINSQAEADFLAKLVADAPKDTVYGNYLRGVVHLGFHNQFGDGFQTIHGQLIENSGYTVWGNGQPDNSSGSELCGTMFYNGQLNDITCNRVCFYICEHDIASMGSSFNERFGI